MRKNVNSPWTEALIADLIRLWDRGYSCSQIGAVIGVTRNAVIGKAHRLKLPSHSRNVNSQTRTIDPKPSGTPRRSPTCRTVFKSRERKPAVKTIDHKPGLMTVTSIITGYPISVFGHRRQRLDQQMTKNEMRAMLSDAAQNTAALEVQ